jgi:hypothetical protein
MIDGFRRAQSRFDIARQCFKQAFRMINLKKSNRFENRWRTPS